MSRLYVVVLIAALASFSHFDRLLTAILLEPIRLEFHLSDLQLGLLTGVVMALVTAAATFPAALLAVRNDRRVLIGVAALVWGAMTALFGAAQSFAHLLLARIGLGVGEGMAPAPSQAMISDLYSAHERGTALSGWASSINVGLFLAFLVGGAIGHAFGWRAAFVCSGLATMALGVLLLLTVRDPVRDAASSPAPPGPALVLHTIRIIWMDRPMRHVCIAVTLAATLGYAGATWSPSFLMRSHGLNVAQVGVLLALIAGLGGVIVTLGGGRVSDLLRRHDVAWSLWFIGLVFLLGRPLSVAFYLLDNTTAALICLLVPGLVSNIYLGPSCAVLHNRVPAELRPLATAVLLLLANLVGLGLGPLLAGAMSQFLFAGSGTDSLRYAMTLMQGVGVWACVHYYLAGRALRADK